MNSTDWAMLGVLLAFIALGFTRQRRRAAIAAIVLFSLLQVRPRLGNWIKQPFFTASWMPFRAYRLYLSPAPERYEWCRLELVTREGPRKIDPRIWQPLIPRVVNEVLPSFRNFAPERQQRIGAVLLNQCLSELKKAHKQTRFTPPNGYFLGPLRYPSHQSGAEIWSDLETLPDPEAIQGLRVLHVVWDGHELVEHPVCLIPTRDE